jgi:hypothetical protein
MTPPYRVQVFGHLKAIVIVELGATFNKYRESVAMSFQLDIFNPWGGNNDQDFPASSGRRGVIVRGVRWNQGGSDRATTMRDLARP